MGERESQHSTSRGFHREQRSERQSNTSTRNPLPPPLLLRLPASQQQRKPAALTIATPCMSHNEGMVHELSGGLPLQRVLVGSRGGGTGKCEY